MGFGKFLLKRARGCVYATRGAWLLLKKEPSIQVQFFIAICVTIAGFCYEISNVEWMMQIFAIGLVMSTEGINTTIEEIADFIHPDFHSKIGLIKDLAAGAVFISAIVAVIIAGIIYIPKIF